MDKARSDYATIFAYLKDEPVCLFILGVQGNVVMPPIQDKTMLSQHVFFKTNNDLSICLGLKTVDTTFAFKSFSLLLAAVSLLVL